MNMSTSKTYGFTTTIVHGDRQKNIEHGSVHKPVHTSVLFGYQDARDLAAVFKVSNLVIAMVAKAIRRSRL